MPVDPRAFGFESEEELIEALRARFGIPYECNVTVVEEVVDGVPVLTMLVTCCGCAHTVPRDGPR
jgi:hypothetical protein